MPLPTPSSTAEKIQAFSWSAKKTRRASPMVIKPISLLLISLFFAWLPIIGDPLTFIAGILRIRFLLFLVLVAIGKIARYYFIYYLVL